MSWREIKTDDVLSYFTPAEAATLKNILQQADTLSPKINDCAASVRGFISAGANQLDAASTLSVPDQLRVYTMAFIAWEWLSSFPGLEKFKTRERGDRARTAQALFERIGSQEANRPRVELPDAVLAKPAPVGGVATPRPGRRIPKNGFDRMATS